MKLCIFVLLIIDKEDMLVIISRSELLISIKITHLPQIKKEMKVHQKLCRMKEMTI